MWRPVEWHSQGPWHKGVVGNDLPCTNRSVSLGLKFQFASYCRALGKRDARKYATSAGRDRCTPVMLEACLWHDAKGLVISPRCFLENELVERQIRDSPAQLQVLLLKLFDPAYLVGL